MEWYEAEVCMLERKAAQSKIPDPVVFYGSSTFRLWETLPKDLESERALNLGFGGSTLAACVHYFDRLVPPVRPCSLVIYAGDNDLGDGQSVEDVVASFLNLSRKIHMALDGVPMGFISIKPSPARYPIQDRIQKANKAIRKLMRDPDQYYIDVHTPMLDGKGKPRRELFETDGLHLNRAGYQLWIKILLAHRNRIFITDCSHIHLDRVS